MSREVRRGITAAASTSAGNQPVATRSRTGAFNFHQMCFLCAESCSVGKERFCPVQTLMPTLGRKSVIVTMMTYQVRLHLDRIHQHSESARTGQGAQRTSVQEQAHPSLLQLCQSRLELLHRIRVDCRLIQAVPSGNHPLGKTVLPARTGESSLDYLETVSPCSGIMVQVEEVLIRY